MRVLPLLISLVTGVQCLAPILGFEDADPLSSSYIVVLKKGTSDTVFNSHLTWANKKLAATTTHNKPTTFNTGSFKGYKIAASNSSITALAESADIDYIEVDQTFTLPSATTFDRQKCVVQANAPWGLARISHRQRGSTDYVYQTTTGTYVYVLDTGVKVTHQAFGGRAICAFSAVSGSPCDDTNGHGTHVAGIASSQTYGVVRYASIVGVKVLGNDGSTTTATIISGINWAVQDIQSKGRVGRATALLTVSGSFSNALNSAIASASNAGIMFAVVAGNDNANAGSYSPGSEPSACTVGGTTIDDRAMTTSNFGAAVDIYAPGQNILSLWITSGTSTNTLSGTSMAAAHIAGLGAYFLEIEGPRTSGLCERLKQVATPNVLTGIPAGTSNLLAYNLSGL